LGLLERLADQSARHENLGRKSLAARSARQSKPGRVRSEVSIVKSPVTRRAEIPSAVWTSTRVSAIVLRVTLVRFLDLSPAAFVVFALPALVWEWGRAIEQLAIGLERLIAIVPLRRDRDGGGTP